MRLRSRRTRVQRRRLGPVARVRNALASLFHGAGSFIGSYSSTDPRNNLNEGWRPGRYTANQALVPTLPDLIAQCRDLERNTADGRAAVEGFKACVVGTGIDIEPNTGDDSLDQFISDEWDEFCSCAGVDGESLWELQAQAAAEIMTSGAPLWRLVTIPERIDQGLPPVAILPLEPEWLAPHPVQPIPPGLEFVAGKLIDALGRPVFYDLVRPDTWNGSLAGMQTQGIRVPADEIIHCYEKRRPLQAHGEPGLAPSINIIRQSQDLIQFTLNKARHTSAMSVAIVSDEHEEGGDSNGDPVNDIPLGATVRLAPGEDVKPIKMEDPSPLIAPFMALLVGLKAAATRLSRRWFDRDPSKTNYSSMRADNLMDERLHRPVQLMLGRHCASRPYLAVLPWILMKARRTPITALERRTLYRHEVLPDRPRYVDPDKDGRAAMQNVDGVLSSLSEEVSARGGRLRQVVRQQEKDNKLLEKHGLTRHSAKGVVVNVNQGGDSAATDNED